MDEHQENKAIVSQTQSPAVSVPQTSSSEEQLPQSPLLSAKHFNRKLILIIGLFIAFLFILSASYYLTISQSKDSNLSRSQHTENTALISPTTEVNPLLKTFENGAFLKKDGDDIFLVRNTTSNLLFYNTKNITHAILGPDGKSVHLFNKNNPEKSYCTYFKDFTEVKAKDFQTIINEKETSLSSANNPCRGIGYIANSDYFAYLVTTADGAEYIVYKNLAKNTSSFVLVDGKTVQDYEARSTQTDAYSLGSRMSASNGMMFTYPHQAVQAGNNLVLGFGTLLVAINTSDNIFIGGLVLDKDGNNNKYLIVSDAYRLKTENDSPFVLLSRGWEGPWSFAAIFDLSNNTLRTTDLLNYDKNDKDITLNLDRRPLYLNYEKVDEWKDNAIYFNFIDFSHVNGPNDIDPETIDAMNEEEYDSYIVKAEAKISSENGNKKVGCYLRMGQYPGCDVLNQINKYKYSSGKGLEEL